MHTHKPLIRMRYLLAIMLTVTLLSSILTVPSKAAVPADIVNAIEDGVQALVDMQHTDGSWHAGTWSNSHPIATTCFALVKLQERAYELEYPSPFVDEYPYHEAVIDGWGFVLDAAKITKTTPLTVQPAGDPDENGNGYGLDFATATGERYGYTNGICLMALASTGTPDRPNDDGLDFNGDLDADTYLELAQDVAEHLAYGQVDSGLRQGGWHYTVGSGANQPAADNSVTGYTVLGLAYAEDFGVTLPDFVKPETDIWVNYIQSADGGSGYNAPGVSNELRTGNLIFEMTFVDGGGAPATQRFKDALAYIEGHWRDANKNPGWGYSLSPCTDYQAMYTLMKGLQFSGIDLIDTDGDTARDDDWFNQEPPADPAQDFASVLVQQQNSATGLWPSDCHQYGDQALCQIWALLILEKISPPPPIDVEIDVPACACDVDGYDVEVTYTVERIPSDGSVEIYKDGILEDTIVLTNFSGTLSEAYNIASATPGMHVWKAVLDVEPVGGGYPAHAEDEASVNVCETPQVGDIPGQAAPFETFDLDGYLTYTGALPVSWSASDPGGGWSVGIDGDNVVTVTAPVGATDPVTITFTASVTCCDEVICSDSDDAVFIPNLPPDCSKAYAYLGCLWPPNNKLVDIAIMGVTDPDGDPVTITVTKVTSDEATSTEKGAGGPKHAPDAVITAGEVQVRAERSGNGDGRVYVISFTAEDGRGGVCEGSVMVKVPHDQSDKTCPAVDSGQDYDATQTN